MSACRVTSRATWEPQWGGAATAAGTTASAPAATMVDASATRNREFPSVRPSVTGYPALTSEREHSQLYLRQ